MTTIFLFFVLSVAFSVGFVTGILWSIDRVGCPHLEVRCTHGDEIIVRHHSRRVCLECGRSLDGPLPDPCHVTGEPHSVGFQS